VSYAFRGFRYLSLRHRVHARAQELPPRTVPIPGESQRYVRILSEGHELCFALMSVGPAPELTAGRRDPKIQTAAVADFAGFFFCLRFFDLYAGKGHRA